MDPWAESFPTCESCLEARGGYEYFVSFIDDYSRYGYIFLMRRKSECFDKFKEYKADVEKHHGKSIKTLRSDRGGEYLSGEFRNYLSEVGIHSQLTAPVPSTPIELWTGRKPSLRHFRIWGCPAHVLKGEADKLEPRTEDQKVIVSTNARFLEEDYIINHKPISKIVLEEIRGESPVSIPTVQEEIPQVAAPRVTSDTQIQTVPRRSGRVVRQPDRYMFLGESSDFIPGEHEPDPLTYDEALQDKDADSWHKAMKSEIESMYSNQVWELVEPLDGVKAIG
ncbi:uncharacterized protein LOC141819490, partial [Curcuma longa]|uniref:uncharacterized protein LOC141819490 n=1 Tax=Curcuma longa TaxID=136217 RepID=UPI003D9F9900